MSAIEFYYDNFLYDATLLGAYGQNDFFPAKNIVDPRTTKVFRTRAGIASGKIFFDLGEVKSPTHCLVKLNSLDPIFPNRHITVRSGTDFDPYLLTNPGSNHPRPYFQINKQVFDQFDINIRKTGYKNTAFRYWSVNAYINEGESFIEIPKVFLGTQALGLENVGIDYGWSLESKSLDKVSRNRYGQKFIDRAINQKIMSLSIRLINKDELDIFMDMFEAVGIHRPVWMFIDPGEVIVNHKERFAIYGYFVSIPKITNNVFAHYDLDLVIEEAI